MNAFIFPCTLTPEGSCDPIPDKFVRLSVADLNTLINSMEITIDYRNRVGGYMRFENFQLKLMLAINQHVALAPTLKDLMMDIAEMLGNETIATHVAWCINDGKTIQDDQGIR